MVPGIPLSLDVLNICLESGERTSLPFTTLSQCDSAELSCPALRNKMKTSNLLAKYLSRLAHHKQSVVAWLRYVKRAVMSTVGIGLQIKYSL